MGKKAQRLESELVVDARRRLLDGIPPDALTSELVRTKVAKDEAAAKKIVAKARKTFRADIDYEELAERCFDLYETARESGDSRGALLALRQWEKWTDKVMRHKMAELAAATPETYEEVLRNKVNAGLIHCNVGTQLRAFNRADELEETGEEVDIETCDDVTALAIALGRRPK